MTSYTSQQVNFCTAFMNTVLAAMKTAPMNPLINTAKLRLNNSPSYNPNQGSTIAGNSANECAYSGYTAGGIAVTLSAPVNLSPTCQGAIISGLFEATSASPFVPDTAYGWWIDDGTNVICGEKFANNGSASFGAPGDFLNLTVTVPEQSLQATS